ncbi:MAG: oxidoreductase [Devosia sp.]|jgi:NAD(P)-dependent dehydrogenase (short-subunit alcohol dehydrogenase family)|nr:oxidoreductase [Devosia sp.]
MRMKNKVVLVIGGASGIGLAIADRLAAEGAEVFLTGRRSIDVDAAVDKIGNGAIGIVGDAGDSSDIEKMMETLRSKKGRIDALIFNAGVSEPAGLANSTPDHFDRHFSVNTRAPMLAMRAGSSLLGKGSAALLIGSIAGVKGVPTHATYAATKAALRSYVRSWTAEFAELYRHAPA